MKKHIILVFVAAAFTAVFASCNKSESSGTNLSVIKANVKGFVFTDKLKVRNAPSLKSNKIDTLEFGDVITYYEISGSGEYKNGTLDKWVKISDTEDQWVNYFYVIQFPAKLEYENKSEIHAYNWESDVNNVYDQLPERIIIEDIIEENNKKYFVITIDDNDYYHNDLHNIRVEMNSIIKNFLPESYFQFFLRNAPVSVPPDGPAGCRRDYGLPLQHPASARGTGLLDRTGSPDRYDRFQPCPGC